MSITHWPVDGWIEVAGDTVGSDEMAADIEALPHRLAQQLFGN
jgi:hypothetical protein